MVMVSAIGSTAESAVGFASVFSAALLATANKALVSSTTASICFFSKRENKALNGARVWPSNG